MSAAWEPPGGPTRAAGGLLGVAGGETWQGGGSGGANLHGRVPDGPVTSALVDLCHSYVARRGEGVPLEVAKRHDGVAGPGWLLAVAVVRPDAQERIGDTLELALAAGIRRHALGDCVTFVEMAAALFAGEPVEAAVEAATGRPAPRPDDALVLCGEPAADAVSAGVWALQRSGGVADVVSALADIAPPGVGAAATGLVGLRDGGGTVPAHWHRRLHCSTACLALAPGLVRARCHSIAPRDTGPPVPPGAETLPAAPVRGVCSRPSPAAAAPFLREPAIVTDFLRRPLVGSGIR